MVFKGLIAATAAIALAASPAVAAATPAAAAVAPASETVEAESQLGGGFIIPLFALAAIILGILVVLDNDDEEPVSP